MTTLLHKLKLLLGLTGKPAPSGAGVVTAVNIKRLAQQLHLTGLSQCSCEEAFELLDEYVDLVDNNAEAEALMPIVKHHIDKCPHCREAFEDLLHALRSEKAR